MKAESSPGTLTIYRDKRSDTNPLPPPPIYNYNKPVTFHKTQWCKVTLKRGVKRSARYSM